MLDIVCASLYRMDNFVDAYHNSLTLHFAYVIFVMVAYAQGSLPYCIEINVILSYIRVAKIVCLI